MYQQLAECLPFVNVDHNLKSGEIYLIEAVDVRFPTWRKTASYPSSCDPLASVCNKRDEGMGMGMRDSSNLAHPDSRSQPSQDLRGTSKSRIVTFHSKNRQSTVGRKRGIEGGRQCSMERPFCLSSKRQLAFQNLCASEGIAQATHDALEETYIN